MSHPVCTILNNGIEIPLLGLGCWDMWDKECETAVSAALEIGYRMIDTAAMYGNEAEVGNAIKSSGIRRDELFIQTKVNNVDQGYHSTMRAYDQSLRKLKLDYVDAYLVHWPIKGKRKETWQALEKIYEEGRVRSIGVCNYLKPFLEELDEYSTVVPVINQCEMYPFLYDLSFVQACQDRSILLQAWSPLIRGKMHDHPTLEMISKKYHKTVAQILLRWALDHGFSTIPKSSNTQRLKENFDLFDFSLSKEDLEALDRLYDGYRASGENPMFML